MDAFAILCSLVLDDDRLWGDAATDVQLSDANAVINGQVPYHFVTRARGYSKTQDNAGIAAASALAAPAGSKLYWLAGDQDQGGLALDSIRGFIDRTPLLRGQLDIQARRVVVPASGTTIEILAADAASAWGLRPYMAFVDEIAQWADAVNARRLWEAIYTAMLKIRDARLVAMTTAGDPRHWSHKVLKVALQSDLWRVSETRGPAPWTSAKALADQRLQLPASVYTQLFENEWIETEGAFLSVENIDQCFTLDSPTLVAEPGRDYFAAMDLGHANDRSVFAIAHRDAHGQIVLDRKRVWIPTKDRKVSLSEVESYVLNAHSLFGFRLTTDPWQAYQMIERLRSRGVVISEFHFSQASKQRLASALLEAFNAGQFALFDSDGFRDELRALRVKPMSNGGYTFDHQTGKGQHDDQAMVLAMLALHASEHSMQTVVEEEWARLDGSEFIYRSGELTMVGDQYRDLDVHPLENSWL